MGNDQNLPVTAMEPKDWQKVKSPLRRNGYYFLDGLNSSANWRAYRIHCIQWTLNHSKIIYSGRPRFESKRRYLPPPLIKSFKNICQRARTILPYNLDPKILNYNAGLIMYRRKQLQLNSLVGNLELFHKRLSPYSLCPDYSIGIKIK
jgi:hypothetical protein